MYSTGIFSIQASLNQVVQLKNKRPGLREQRQKAGNILQIRPYDTVARSWLGSGCPPNYVVTIIQSFVCDLFGLLNSLSTFSNVKIPNLSNCVLQSVKHDKLIEN